PARVSARAARPRSGCARCAHVKCRRGGTGPARAASRQRKLAELVPATSRRPTGTATARPHGRRLYARRTALVLVAWKTCDRGHRAAVGRRGGRVQPSRRGPMPVGHADDDKPFAALPTAGGLLSRLAAARLSRAGIAPAPLLKKTRLTVH